MGVYVYTKSFIRTLDTVYKKKAQFLNTFGGGLQIVDGVTDNDKFLELKTVEAETVIQEYNTDPNVGMGTGTASSSRFGPINEIKAVNTSVPFEAPLAIHEGIDNFTVNGPKDRIVLERLAQASEAWTEQINGMLGTAISENAGNEMTVELTEAGLTQFFADAHKLMVNNHVSKDRVWRAYVTADVLDVLVNAGLTTTAKRSSANVEEQEMYKFKGFVLEELPETYFEEGEIAYITPDNIGVAGTGIQIVRTLEARDFYGTQIQGAAKYAKYIPEQNQDAMIKGIATEATEETPEA